MTRWSKFRESNSGAFFLRYSLLFVMLLIAVASIALRGILVGEANPFFYANF
jgi:hypothetical protein